MFGFVNHTPICNKCIYHRKLLGSGLCSGNSLGCLKEDYDKRFCLIFSEVFGGRVKMVPLHPLEDPSSQLHCSFLPNLSHRHQQNLSKKDSQGKLLRARPTPIKYSTRCVPGITNLGPNSKCVIFSTTDTECQNILNIRFDLNNYNWFMEALMAKHKTCKMEIFTRRTI